MKNRFFAILLSICITAPMLQGTSGGVTAQGKETGADQIEEVIVSANDADGAPEAEEGAEAACETSVEDIVSEEDLTLEPLMSGERVDTGLRLEGGEENGKCLRLPEMEVIPGKDAAITFTVFAKEGTVVACNDWRDYFTYGDPKNTIDSGPQTVISKEGKATITCTVKQVKYAEHLLCYVKDQYGNFVKVIQPLRFSTDILQKNKKYYVMSGCGATISPGTFVEGLDPEFVESMTCTWDRVKRKSSAEGQNDGEYLHDWDSTTLEEKIATSFSVPVTNVQNSWCYEYTLENPYGYRQHGDVYVLAVSSPSVVNYEGWYHPPGYDVKGEVTAALNENDATVIPVEVCARPGSQVSFVLNQIDGDGKVEIEDSQKTMTVDENCRALYEYSLYHVDRPTDYECVATTWHEGREREIHVLIHVVIDTGLVIYALDGEPKTIMADCKTFEAPGEEYTLHAVATCREGFQLSYAWYDARAYDFGEREPLSTEAAFSLTVNETKTYRCKVTVKKDGIVFEEDSYYIELKIDTGLEFETRNEGGSDYGKKVDLWYLEQPVLDAKATAKKGYTPQYTWSRYLRGAPKKEMLSEKGGTLSPDREGYYVASVTDGCNTLTRTFHVSTTQDKGYFAGKPLQVSCEPEIDAYYGYHYDAYTLLPETTGTYTITATKSEAGCKDGFVGLYDADKKLLAEITQPYYETTPFGEMTCEMEAGKTYYLRAACASGSYTLSIAGGTFYVPPEPTPEPAHEPTQEAPGAMPTNQPAQGDEGKYVAHKNPVLSAEGYYVTTTAKGDAMLISVKKTSAKKLAIKSTVRVDGVSYTLVGAEKAAFQNAKKATTVTLPKTFQTLKAYAFKGSKVKTVKLTVKKGMTLKLDKNVFKKSKVKNVQVSMKGASAKKKKAMKNALKAGFKRAKIKGYQIKVK